MKVELIILSCLIQFFNVGLNNYNNYVFSRIAQSVNFILKRLLLIKLVDIPYEEYEKSKFFDEINLAYISINANGFRVVNYGVAIIGNVISLLGILGILISIHWIMPLALFIPTIPGIILLFISKTKNYKNDRYTSSLERELSFIEGLFINRNSIKELKLFNIGRYLIEHFA
ncbi:hypothetical protein D3C76_378960 [compost metagenome]